MSMTINSSSCSKNDILRPWPTKQVSLCVKFKREDGNSKVSLYNSLTHYIYTVQFIQESGHFKWKYSTLCIVWYMWKFTASCPITQSPTQMLKSWFSEFSSQEIGSRLISFEMIFKSLQLELFRFWFHSLSSKILKIPEFNLIYES